MNLRAWLEASRGRSKALADFLQVTPGRVSQMIDDGVPPKYMFGVRDFTGGEVSLEDLVGARTPELADPKQASVPEGAANV